MNQSTITAIATPVGKGGIGIIRISGPKAFDLTSSIFVPKSYKIRAVGRKTIDTNMIESHKLYYGYILHPKEKNIIDEVLVTFMKAPKTYTTENVVEIQAHSSFVNLEHILSIILEIGAIIAKPGEFTQRAFLGGRIDLTQAESVLDLINAKTRIAALNAAKSLGGSKKIILEEVRSSLRQIQANYERILEFSEEIYPEENNIASQDIIENQLLSKVNLLLRQEKDEILYQHGIEIAIVGAPNVGKSTLMNCLMKENRCIVANIPGTTRDVIKGHISINNIPITLHDTAGLRKTSDTVELISINKTMEVIKKSNIILIMVDSKTQSNTLKKEIIKNYPNKKILVVLNKIDICNKKSLLKFRNNFNSYETVEISAKTNLCINKLETTIARMITMSKENSNDINIVSSNFRQYHLLKKTKFLLKNLLKSVRNNETLDILSYQTEECVAIIDKISGTKKNNDLHEYIFDKFCIGK